MNTNDDGEDDGNVKYEEVKSRMLYGTEVSVMIDVSQCWPRSVPGVLHSSGETEK